MNRSLSIVLGDHPHTALVRSRTVLAGLPVSFPAVSPVHSAFPAMVREQRYDVCEMALATFFQAREAGKPLLLLPVVLVGGFHHGNIRRAPGSRSVAPQDLLGRRVGVRAYSTTMGLWARSVLDDEYGVDASRVTWVTTEDPHVDEYTEPANVVRAAGGPRRLLFDGDLTAAILNGQENPDLEPVIPDPVEAALRWHRRYGTVPVNHLVVVTRTLLERAPEVVTALYEDLVAGIDGTELPPADGSGGQVASPVRHGREAVRTAVELAAHAALRQRLIRRPVGDLDELFAL
jgi:4,5-dihydroxyphthalate decarboxylase